MEIRGTNAEATIALALSNLNNIVMGTLEQYETQLKALGEHVQKIQKEVEQLRAENDSLHTQLNQVEPDPLTEK